MKTFGFSLVMVLGGCSLASAQPAHWTDCRLLSSYAEGHDELSRRPGDGTLSDRFGRNVVLTGVTLVDWEGHAGNPELTHFLYPPQGASFPVAATVTVEQAPLVYVRDGSGLKSEHSEGGPTFRHVFSGTAGYAISLGVNPDRNDLHETYVLRAHFRDARGAEAGFSAPLRVCDQDYERPSDFRFILDVTHDRTGFYTAHPEAVGAMQQIADDIAYYLADQETDAVQIGEARSRVGDTPTQTGSNTIAFSKALYLFSTGWRHGTEPNDIWSTGFAGTTRFTRNREALPLFNAGIVRPHPDGDRSAKNTKGWSFELDDSRWWTVSRDRRGVSPTGDCPNGEAECDYYFVSFYSVMKHELLHTLGYGTPFPKWQEFSAKGCIDDPAVMAYTGRCSPLADAVHAWDPRLHRRHWNEGVELLDKFELLVLQAVGWRLRDTTPLMRITITDTTLAPGRRGEPYLARIGVRGGVPSYHFTVIDGALPSGLQLNPFTGEVKGTTNLTGTHTFRVRVADNDVDNSIAPNGATATITLLIGS